MIKYTLFSILMIGFLFACLAYQGADEHVISPDQLSLHSGNDLLTPTPFLFQEMTIPSLRDRSYTSSIQSQDLYEKNSSYTSYIASYLSDGISVHGLLTIPTGKKPEKGWPAIVFVHGYIPPKEYSTTEKYVAYVDALAKNGFVVFKIDLRGHGSSGGQAGGGYYSADYVIDTLNAYAALQDLPSVDHQHIGLWGHSMAGNIVMRSIVVNQHIPAAVIWSGAGYTYQDLLTYRIGDRSYQSPPPNSSPSLQRQRIRSMYGDPLSTRSAWFWKQMSPTNYLSGIQTAIQIHHALDDTVVSSQYSKDLMNILDTTSLPHELFTYPSGGHNITDPSFTTAMQRTISFFHMYLSGEGR